MQGVALQKNQQGISGHILIDNINNLDHYSVEKRFKLVSHATFSGPSCFVVAVVAPGVGIQICKAPSWKKTESVGCGTGCRTV